MLVAAAIQLNATDDLARNQALAEDLVRQAAAAGATLIVLPEKWPVIGPGRVIQAAAEPLDGPRVAFLKALAAELRIDLVAGSIPERLADTERVGNTSLHLGPDGELKAAYRKVHLFDVEVDGHRYEESRHEQAGGEAVVTGLADGTPLGLSVCFDVRFPELYRTLALRGARILTVPAAFTLATTRDHWEVLVRARAIENAAFVVAANQIGEHPGGMRSGGRSLIVDPWGTVAAQVPDHDGFATCALNLEAQERTRAQIPVLGLRRPEVYA